MSSFWQGAPRVPIQSPKTLCVLFLLLLSVLVRLINLDSPLFTGNTFRQTLTAITVWTYIKEGISIGAYQTPVFGPPWTMPVEFPIYQLTVALLVKLGVMNIDMAGRIATILYFYLSASFLFLISRRYLGTIASTCVLLFYVWSPFMIVWSRNFMIDYASVAFSLGYFYCFTRWFGDPRKIGYFLLTIAFGILAFLTKVTTLPTVLIPMGYLVSRDILFRLRNEKYQFVQYIKVDVGFLASVAAVFLVPIVPFLLWIHHSDTIKASSEFTAPFTSAGLSEWNFGTWTQRMAIKNWGTIAKRVVSMIVTFPALVFLIFGPWLYFRSSRKEGEFVLTFALGAIVTVFTFFNLYWVHDYYLMAISPSISIVVGFCSYLVLTKLFEGNFELKRWFYVAILLIAIMLYSTGNYVRWPFEVTYDMPLPTLKLAQAIRDNTSEDDYVIVADVFNWDPEYLYYARRKGFMLWYFEGDKSNEFFKKHNFTTVVHAEAHPKLFSNWKYQKLLAVYDKFKIVRVSDTPIP
jgi:Dolichyl-phosphate-mannose-protein mannosyltransferase